MLPTFQVVRAVGRAVMIGGMGTSADDGDAPTGQEHTPCGLIDPSRMAMAGHSAGGAAAIAAMLADSRIRAGIDMDGATHAQIPDDGLSRPFLFLGKQSNYTREAEGISPGSQAPRAPGSMTGNS